MNSKKERIFICPDCGSDNITFERLYIVESDLNTKKIIYDGPATDDYDIRCQSCNFHCENIIHLTEDIVSRDEDGDIIWEEGTPAECAILVDTGRVAFKTKPKNIFCRGNIGVHIQVDPTTAFASGKEVLQPEMFERGSFIGDIDAILANRRNDVALTAMGSVSVLCLYRKELLNFFSNNPGVLLSMLHTRYIL